MALSGLSCTLFSTSVGCSLQRTSRTLPREVQRALVVVFAIENLKRVFPLVLLCGLTDLQPGHLLTSSDPHVLTGGDLSLSRKQHGHAQFSLWILCSHLLGHTSMSKWEGFAYSHLIGEGVYSLAHANGTVGFGYFFLAIININTLITWAWNLRKPNDYNLKDFRILD